MAQAVRTLQDGFVFQARIFWLKAANLLDPQRSIVHVGIESGPKGFDDVWVEYDAVKAPSDQFGQILNIERMQCKWHATPGSFTYLDLTSPAYIGATSVSFLQRAHDAYRQDQVNGKRSRLALVTNHRVSDDDPLKPLIRSAMFNLDVDKLFEGKTALSATGKVRKAWREHLDITDDELRPFCEVLSFNMTYESLELLGQRLDDVLRSNGLKRPDPQKSASEYESTAFAWVGQGRREFDRRNFREVCSREGFLEGPVRSGLTYGVKSFEHPFDRLEDRCEQVLSFLPDFDGRFIRDAKAWSEKLQPELRRYLSAVAAKEARIRLAIDAHTSLAFAAGAILDTKSGRMMEIEQRTPLPNLWHPDDEPYSEAWPTWEYDREKLSTVGSDLAVAVTLNRDVEHAVRKYIQQHLPRVSLLIVAKPRGGASQTSVICGAHANLLAESLTSQIRMEKDSRTEDALSRVHLFIAAPNGFTAFLGRHVQIIQPLTLYEYDFEGLRHRTYEPALSIPAT